MVKDVYAVKLRYMIIIFFTLLNEKSTFIMVDYCRWGFFFGRGEGGSFPPAALFWGEREEWVKPGCAEVALRGDHWKVQSHERLVLVQLSDCVSLFRCFQGFFSMFPGRVFKQVRG